MKKYNRAIEAAAEAAYVAYMETMMGDPRVSRDEADEKARYIMEQVLLLKTD
mgnify:CR=1 FL=1